MSKSALFLTAAAFLWAAAPAFAHRENSPAQAPSHILNCMAPAGHHATMEETVCPLGGEKFDHLEPGVFSTFGTHLDGMPLSYLPLPPPLPVCPSNGFVVSKEDYSTDDLARIERIITAKAYQDLYKARHASFYLHAYIEKALHEDPATYWPSLLAATWEAFHCHADEKYKLYAESTLEAAQARLEDLKQSDGAYAEKPEYWRLNIVVADLYRRLGRFDAAAAWLESLDKKVPESVGGAKYAKWSFALLDEAIAAKNSKPVTLRDPAKPE